MMRWLLWFLCGLFWKKLEDIFLVFGHISKQSLRIAILHLILMKSCDLYFIGVFSCLFQVRIYFLLQLNSDRFRMGVWFRIRFVIIFRLLIRIIFFGFTKLKTILMAFIIFICTSSSLFGFLNLLLFKITRKVMRSLTEIIIPLQSGIYAARSGVIERRWVNVGVKCVGTRITLVKLFWASKIDRFIDLSGRKDKFVTFDIEIGRKIIFIFSLVHQILNMNQYFLFSRTVKSHKTNFRLMSHFTPRTHENF